MSDVAKLDELLNELRSGYDMQVDDHLAKSIGEALHSAYTLGQSVLTEGRELSAREYLEAVERLSDRVSDEQWKQADRALWAAYELQGLVGRVTSKGVLDWVRFTAIAILKTYPDGLPEPKPTVEP